MNKLDYSILAEYQDKHFIEALISIEGHSSSVRVCFQIEDFTKKELEMKNHDVTLALAIHQIPRFIDLAIYEAQARFYKYCEAQSLEYTDPVLFELDLNNNGSVDYYFSFYGDLEFESINFRELPSGELVVS